MGRRQWQEQKLKVENKKNKTTKRIGIKQVAGLTPFIFPRFRIWRVGEGGGGAAAATIFQIYLPNFFCILLLCTIQLDLGLG
jgi:hypothetical protein